MFFEHYSLVPEVIWRWYSFQPKEIASRMDGSLLINFSAMDKLQSARELANRPFYINSAYRDEMHNSMIGGSPRSYHLEGRAFDISLKNFEKDKLIKILENAGFTGFGVNYNSFVHCDDGKERRW
jgi:uncharacterized protein YcbK (DUF882 family)